MLAREPRLDQVSQYDASVSSEESSLREALKRCSPETIEAVLAFRATGRAAYVPTIVVGVIERYVERDLRPKLQNASDDLRLVEDLALDSLTLMETVILLEEVLQVTIHNEELRALRTLGDAKEFVDCKVRGLPLPARGINAGTQPSGASPLPFASKATNATME